MSREAPEAPRLVVGVGASAGGLDAFKRLLAVLPGDAGMTFLFVQHLDPNWESHLAAVIEHSTDLAVRDAEQGAELEPDTVYTIRPDTALAVEAGRLVESKPVLHRGIRMPIDHLFGSLAREYGPRSVGVLLSGAGNDGSAGARSIKIAGGLSIAQNPDSSRHRGMPDSAIEAGVVDLVLDLDEIPAALARFADLPTRVRAPAPEDHDGPPRKLTEENIARLVEILGSQLSFDLRLYKPGTIERRILRRAGLCGFERITAYLEYLRDDETEQRNLVGDLLISVTDFFRDPEAFRALREMVIDPLVTRADGDAQLRVWVPGCATGEEAYSIGMEFLDAIAAHDGHASVQVFATDIDQEALAVARSAVYSSSIVERVSEARLERYFKPIEGRGFQVASPLRDIVSFAAHDLTRDPPFSRMHLVSCRNVLIYLTAEAQRHVLDVLHFALEPGGHLFLSTSESTGVARDLFTTVSKVHRVYQKVGDSRPIALKPSRKRTHEVKARPREVEPPARPPIPDPARQAVIEALVPPTLVISSDGAVLFSHGELGPYLRIPEGEGPRLEIGSLLRPEIAIRTRSALYKCRQTGEPVVVSSSPDTSGRTVRISARRAFSLDDAVILTFEDVEVERAAPPAPEPEGPTRDGFAQLEAELSATREDLRNAVEELESSNEQLRASNEESMSVNEELQSSNEELEATSEELRSLNEELTTANIQLREKIEELEQAHDDLDNFFASTKIATLFLDEQLRIKRFTPAARELLGIDSGDAGRAIDTIARELLQGELETEARAVLEHLAPKVREIRTREGRWISRQVLPYRTASRRIEGVVVTFVDVTDLRAATERLAMREREQSVLARLGLQALRATDLQSFMDQVVRDVSQTLEVEYCKILELQPGGGRLLLRAGIGWRAGLVGAAYVDAGLDSQAGYTLQSSEPVIVEDLSTEKRFSGPDLLTSHQVTAGLSSVIRDGDQVYGVVGAHTSRPRRFTSDDTAFLHSVANLVGSAVGRHQTRTRLGVELGVANLLGEHDRFDEAIPEVLEHLTTGLGASIGELWLPDDSGALSRAMFHSQVPESRIDVDAKLGERFEPGQGLVGWVFERGRATWCSDLGDPSLFVRPHGARGLGLVSGVGFPVISRNRVVGVVTAFSTNRLIADSVFLRSLESIGRAIGEFMVRSELEQRARRLAAITESAHDAILSYNEQGMISEWLAGSEELFGYSAAEMIGGSVERIVPEDRRDELWQINARIRRGEVVEPFETVRIRKDGRLVEVSVRSAAVRDRQGQFSGISSTDRDITRLKETERKLLEASRQKDEFISMLSHELRNPLAAIRSATELLKMTVDDPKIAPTQTILERQTAHMAKLLDGLLDVSRIVRGKIQLEREVVDLAAVCRQVAADAIERLGARDLEIRTEVPSTPMRVEADRVRLAQILDNLMSNAIRHTPDGGRITLKLARQGDTVSLGVRDTGEGIEGDLLPHIFEVFRQSKQNLARSHGGLGLGLALVKSLAELHGGEVEARSDGKGKGAEFVVRLPITRKLPAPAKNNVGAAPLDILLVEDNVDAGEMLKQVLEISGHRVAVATRGQQGIEMALQDPPDVVLCDLGLPDGVSGFDVARRLRDAPETANIRLIALSGYGRSEDMARSSEAGFDAHLTKPVDVHTLSRLLGDRESAKPSA